MDFIWRCYLISNFNDIFGIVAYSLFQLPSDYNERNKILGKIIKKKKVIFFAVEQMKVSNLEEQNNINSIWEIKKILSLCPQKI